LEPSGASLLECEILQLGEDAMAIQVVMDHSGDSRHWYDVNDERSLFEAKERFKQYPNRVTLRQCEVMKDHLG
jgi:hypothetical protein